jgi:hypothetical protein
MEESHSILRGLEEDLSGIKTLIQVVGFIAVYAITYYLIDKFRKTDS